MLPFFYYSTHITRPPRHSYYATTHTDAIPTFNSDSATQKSSIHLYHKKIRKIAPSTPPTADMHLYTKAYSGISVNLAFIPPL